MNDLFQRLKSQGCTIYEIDNDAKPAYHIKYDNYLLLKTGTYKRKGEFIEIPLTEIRNHSPVQDKESLDIFINKVQFVLDKERTDSRRRTRPGCYITNLSQQEKESLVKALIQLGKSLSHNDISFLGSNTEIIANHSNTQSGHEFYSNGGEANHSANNCKIIVYPEENKEEDNLYREGKLEKVYVNHYERNPSARLRCLEHFGYSCAVCDMNFKDRYGSIGQEYIHVHHKTPLSTIGDDYKIDAVRDLIPVCPNCHAMLHKNNPPFSVEALKSMLR
jgi:hypothetical protein